MVWPETRSVSVSNYGGGGVCVSQFLCGHELIKKFAGGISGKVAERGI